MKRFSLVLFVGFFCLIINISDGATLLSSGGNDDSAIKVSSVRSGIVARNDFSLGFGSPGLLKEESLEQVSSVEMFLSLSVIAGVADEPVAFKMQWAIDPVEEEIFRTSQVILEGDIKRFNESGFKSSNTGIDFKSKDSLSVADVCDTLSSVFLVKSIDIDDLSLSLSLP